MLTALRLSAWGDVTRGLAENHRNFSCAASPPAAELWDPIPSHWCPGSSTLQGSAPPIPLHVSLFPLTLVSQQQALRWQQEDESRASCSPRMLWGCAVVSGHFC